MSYSLKWFGVRVTVSRATKAKESSFNALTLYPDGSVVPERTSEMPSAFVRDATEGSLTTLVNSVISLRERGHNNTTTTSTNSASSTVNWIGPRDYCGFKKQKKSWIEKKLR